MITTCSVDPLTVVSYTPIVNISNEEMTGGAGPGPDYPLSFADETAASSVDLEAEFNNPQWDVLAALGLWLVSILLVFAVPTLIALPYILFRYAGTNNAAQVLVTDPTVLLLSVLGVIPAHILTFGAAWAIVTNYGRRPFWRALGWSFSPKFGFMLSAGLAIALYIAGSVVAKLIGGDPTDIDILANSSLAVRLLLAVLATTSGPLVEEIVYRGVIYTSLEKRVGMIRWEEIVDRGVIYNSLQKRFGLIRWIGKWGIRYQKLYPSLQKRIGVIVAVVIVSFLFVLVHVYQYRNSLGAIAVIALLSVSLTLVRARTGRLLPCFIMHMFFNGVVSLIIIFYPYLEQFQKGAEQKPQAGMILWRIVSIFP